VCCVEPMGPHLLAHEGLQLQIFLPGTSASAGWLDSPADTRYVETLNGMIDLSRGLVQVSEFCCYRNLSGAQLSLLSVLSFKCESVYVYPSPGSFLIPTAGLSFAAADACCAQRGPLLLNTCPGTNASVVSLNF
jgi:hypothetical protein